MTELGDTRFLGDGIADAVTRIKDAANGRAIAMRSDRVETTGGQDELQEAVLAARHLGVTWQTIGEALGIARGNAYQRFRRRPGMRRTP